MRRVQQSIVYALAVALLIVGAVTPTAAITANPRVQVVVLPQQAFNPGDSTTYYFGALGLVGPSTVQSIAKIRPGYHGRVTAAYLDVLILTTQGSAENSTASLRLNATTDTTLSTVVQHDQAVGATELFSATGLNLIFDNDDVLEGKIVTPVFATNPAGVYYTFTLVLEQLAP